MVDVVRFNGMCLQSQLLGKLRWENHSSQGMETSLANTVRVCLDKLVRSAWMDVCGLYAHTELTDLASRALRTSPRDTERQRSVWVLCVLWLSRGVLLSEVVF